MRCDFTKKIKYLTSSSSRFAKMAKTAAISLVLFPIYWRNLAFYRRKSSRKLGCKQGYQLDRYLSSRCCVRWIFLRRPQVLYLYCYTSPAANPMRDVFPVFSRNYVFFLHFSVKLIEKKTRKSCNSLLVHYNYKIRKLCKLIPFNRYSSILAFFQNLFNCPAVSRKKKSGKIYNIKPVKKPQITNSHISYIIVVR